MFLDLAVKLFDSSEGYEAFTRVSHHHNVSFVICVQNYFAPGKYGVTIRRSFTDLIIFPDSGDSDNMSNMSKKMFGNATFLHSCALWLDAHIKLSYDRFILVDQNNTSPTTPPSHFKLFSVRTNLFADESGTRRIVYLTPPKNK